MDIVKIGFVVTADGLKTANKEVDSLLANVDKIGTKGKKAASEFETSQNKVASSSKDVTKEVDKTSRALEKQKLIGDYLGRGLDKTTASAIASFKQLGATSNQTNNFISTLLNNKGLDQTRKDLELLSKEQERQAKIVQNTIAQYEKLSSRSLGGGILDSIEKQNRSLTDMRKHYLDIEGSQEKQNKISDETVAKYEKLSSRSFGKGILDQVEKQNKGLQELNSYYKTLEKEQDNISKKQQAALDKEEASQKKINGERQKAVELEQLKSKYTAQGFGKTSSTKLARLEVGGADVTTLDNYKRAIEETNRAMRSMTPVSLNATKSNNTLLGSIKGIAAYALLSTAIYGTISALTNLTVSLVETADEMTNLTQRLNIYLPANIKVNQVLERMGEIAKENRVTLADTGKLFTQLLPPIQRIKGGVAEATAIVDAFGKAMLIGGANTKEAASATIQFGQAMASGKLAGDEFRSLAEASPRLLQAIADGAGIAAQKLKEMSSAGKLTSGLVSAALLDQFIQLEYEAAKMGQTVSGAFNEGMVAYQLFVNQFNEQTGFTQGLVSSIRDVVKSLEGFGKGFLESLKDGDSTLNSFLSLLSVIWDIVGSLVKGFFDVVGFVIQAGEKTGTWKTILDVTKASIITIVDTLLKIPFVIVNIGARITELLLTPFEKFIALAQKGLDLAGFTSAADKLGQGLSSYRGTMNDIKGVTGQVIVGTNLLSLGVKSTEKATGNVSDLLAKLQGQNKNLVIQEKEKKAMTDAQYISEYAKLLLQQEGIAANSENLKAVEKELKARFDITQEQAKQLKLQGELQAKRDEAEAKAKKAREDAEKAHKKALENFQDQVGYVGRLQALLAKGVDAEAAKIAAEKEYAQNITGTSLAIEVAQARQEQGRIDHLISLAQEEELQGRLLSLQSKGATYAQARATAEAGFAADARGLEVLQQSITNELFAQHFNMADQILTQDGINKQLAKGLKLEEATTRETFNRLNAINGGLTKEQTSLRDNLIIQQKQLKLKQTEESVLIDIAALDKQRTAYIKSQESGYAKIASSLAVINKQVQNPELTAAQAQQLVDVEELVNSQKALATLKMETYLSTLNESDAVKELLRNYTTLDSVQIGQLDRQQRILAVLKEYSAEQQKQKNNPLGDFSNVDFNVFGDFGNPFQSALDGLNEFVAKTKESREILSSLEADILQTKEKGLDVSDLELQKNQLLLSQQQSRSKAIDKSITSALALTKSLFKEESKGYKVVSGLEQAYQASKIAFALWEKKDAIAMLALEVKGMLSSAATFVTTTATKLAAQLGFNVAKGTEAVLTQGSGDPYTAFPRMAAMAAVVAALGVAIGSISGGSTGSFAATNSGTGTVFGDSEAQSASIANSIELLSNNSDLMLPLTSSMLRSLRNIESTIGGVTNLILRQATGNSSITTDGFTQNMIGGFLEKAGNSFFASIGDFLGVNKMIGGLLGSLFGSKTSIEGQGLFGGAQSLGNILSEGFNLQEYIDIQTKKKSFGITTSTKNSTQFSAANKELEKQFTLIFSGFYDSILSATDILGANTEEVKTKLENAIINIGKIDLQGLNGEQIQERLEAVFGAAADNLAQQGFAGLDAFQKVGEGYYETLVRVASAVEEAAYYTDRLNVTTVDYTDILNKQGDVAAEIVRQSVLLTESTKDIKGGTYDLISSFEGTAQELTDFVFTLRDLQDLLIMTGKDASYLTSAMILGAGGLENLTSGFDAYFEMLSPAEQAAELTRRLTNEFAIFGKELPADVKAFRNLVSSIDISTEAGQKLYGQILALAPEFNDLQDALENANSDVNALVKSLRDLAEQARAARGETEQPRNLAYLRNEFQKASELALQGDTEAAARMLSLGQSLMSASKMYSTSAGDYAKDLAFIQGIATAVANLQEAGLGKTTTNDLIPVTGAGTTTIATTNITTDEKLDTLREEFNAGLFAVAKYTQDMSSRLERWDDGSRMLVGMLPENGDVPIPVAVTP